MRRYLSLWIPFLSADRWWHKQGRLTDACNDAKNSHSLLAFVEKQNGGVRLAAVDAAAWRNGLRPGLSLADARARCPSLRAVNLNSEADEFFLTQLSDSATAFTPSIALDKPNGLVLDLTGCTHLFGGEAKLAQRLEGMLRPEGVTVCRLAVAPTPDMARALARFAHASPCFAHDATEVRTLPVAALECSSEDSIALKRAGLRTIGDIAGRPSVLFTARFKPAFTVKLSRILGEEDRCITPLRSQPACQAEHRYPEPLISHDVIEKQLAMLVNDVSHQLRARGEGGRLFQSTFLRSDGAVRHIRVETSQPTRDCAVIIRLYRDRFDALADPLDPGFGFDVIRFKVLRSEPYDEHQITLDARDENNEQVAQLIDRLGVMFGRSRVMQLKLCDSHIPERAQRIVAAADGTTKKLASVADDKETPRPLFIYPRPHPIETNTDECGQPSSFHWRRRTHQIAYSDGPERISDEWWQAPSGYGARDYYHVENIEGRRFWIFCADVTGSTPSKWFLHGLFP